MTPQLPPIADIPLPNSIPKDSHWWLWSQSTRRIELEYPAGTLNLSRQQKASPNSWFLVKQNNTLISSAFDAGTFRGYNKLRLDFSHLPTLVLT
ncbi:MAG: hypothetical protein JW953_22155, partial [Anaerolineae bacterium]|nr:hypothetical protein [Anaerolineae bacterium]